MNEPKPDSRARDKSGEALIYVVDDEPMLLELASVILEPLGYTIETFRAPESALRAFTAAEQQRSIDKMKEWWKENGSKLKWDEKRGMLVQPAKAE